MSVVSVLSGAVLAGLVYGLSFLPTATLDRPDDIGLVGDDRTLPESGDAEAPADPQRDAGDKRSGT